MSQLNKALYLLQDGPHNMPYRGFQGGQQTPAWGSGPSTLGQGPQPFMNRGGTRPGQQQRKTLTAKRTQQQPNKRDAGKKGEQKRC